MRKPAAAVVQTLLHVLVAMVLVTIIDDPLFSWDFWAVMLSLPAIRIVDEWDNA